ncbi:hypothetical protein [Streptomyces sp. TRM68367]|uniref:hypothetical protein n=1 Tax=Streptomyces sp. TRM68367 TaxID=2758415 RepID=UPI00165B7B18|nr:hypothetical protein [Streptomyces sp. TRM68367]MBC9730526.1 hypothetical protein [Streptomyces sp. TRM68367]
MPDAGLDDAYTYYPPDPSDKPAPLPEFKPWDPSTFHAPHTRSGPTTTNVEAPPVPTGTGKGGRTVVDTASLDLFASNMLRLADPCKKAYTKVLNVQTVTPGSFYDAYKLGQAICGDAGLQGKYLTFLHALGQGLADIATACQDLSRKYSTIEDENKMSADEVLSAMQPAQGDFSKFTSGG